jgi:hypothetical protein
VIIDGGDVFKTGKLLCAPRLHKPIETLGIGRGDGSSSFFKKQGEVSQNLGFILWSSMTGCIGLKHPWSGGCSCGTSRTFAGYGSVYMGAGTPIPWKFLWIYPIYKKSLLT